MGGERLVARYPIEAALCDDPTQERASEAVGLEDAVPRRAGGRSDLAALCAAVACASGWIVDSEERLGSEAQDAAVADLVPGDQRVIESRGVSLGAGEHLLLFEDRLDGQESEPRDIPLAALDAIPYALTEHLVAAADTQGRETKPRPLGQSAVETARAEPFEVSDGGLSTGEYGKVGGEYLLRRLREPHRHARLVRQGVEVGEVADPGQTNDRDVQGIPS